MVQLENRQLSIMVLYCIVLHLVWAVLVVIDNAALGATAINALYRFVGSTALLAPILVAASCMATVALWTRIPWIIILLLPQQFLLMLSAAGAFGAMYIGQFADGITRPHIFIVADQIHIILASIGHTIAIIAHARAKTK